MENTEAHQLDYHAIVDGIYIGTNQCCQVHFDELLKQREGITADISLEAIRLDQPFGVDFYLWLPTEDHTAPSPHQLRLGAAAITELVAMRKKVYVHCKNGHGRAPTLVAAYLITTKGMGSEEAEVFLKARRPSMHLWDSQREALRAFAQR